MASSPKNRFLRKSSAPGSAAAPDRWLLPQKDRFLRKSSATGSAATLDKWLVQKTSDFWKKFGSRQRSCPGQVASSKKDRILRISSAPDKWFLQKSRRNLENKFCPWQRSCPRQVGRSRRSDQPLQPRRGAPWNAGGLGDAAPQDAGGVGGAAPPPPC